MKYAVAVLTILFLAACGGTQESRTKTASPEPFSVISNTPTVFASATHTPIPITKTPNSLTGTPHPSPTPRLNTPLESGTGILLTSIQMFDSQNGWGFDSDYHILRTRNGGKTWQDVTPPSGYYSPSGFFALDADTAWATFTVGLYLNPQTAYVWHTEDGGDTWTRSQELRLDLDEQGEPYPSEFYLPQGMQFIDQQTGWLLAAVSYNMNSARPLFFRTTDGGDTWKAINSRIGFPDACIGVGFVFIDAHTGWLGGNCFSRGVVFTPMQSIFAEDSWSVKKTVDGGSTYEERTMMPAPAELQQPNVLETEGNCGEIRLLPIDEDVLGIEWGCSIFTPLGPDYRYFSLSSNGGRTWTSWKSTGNEFFLNATYGWRLLPPGEIQQTTDGGLNWLTIKFVTWEDAKFDFVSEQEGWAVASIGRARILLHSINGGRTWADLHPLIGP
jgi:photosystem II stability/assembly factor-like uncharacterized protein